MFLTSTQGSMLNFITSGTVSQKVTVCSWLSGFTVSDQLMHVCMHFLRYIYIYNNNCAYGTCSVVHVHLCNSAQSPVVSWSLTAHSPGKGLATSIIIPYMYFVLTTTALSFYSFCMYFQIQCTSLYIHICLHNISFVYNLNTCCTCRILHKCPPLF